MMRSLMCHRSLVAALGACFIAAVASAEDFPVPRFNGLQISYTITGAKLSAPSDGGPFEGWVRTYGGQLQGDTLRFSGSLISASSKEYPARGSVTVTAGDQRASATLDLTVAGGQVDVRKPFDLSVKIPKGCTSASVTATVGRTFTNGEERFVTVTGTFKAAPPPPPPPKPQPLPPVVSARALVSGAAWCDRFPDSKRLDDPKLQQPFRTNVQRFLKALQDAGASVPASSISTYRPVERAYLMHWAWLIAKKGADPTKVPPMSGVAIMWAHRGANGKVDLAASKIAAAAMVAKYRIAYEPRLVSAHSQGLAVDWAISWGGALKIKNANGKIVTISSKPRHGGSGNKPAGNAELRQVAATYGLKHVLDDWPHWCDIKYTPPKQ